MDIELRKTLNGFQDELDKTNIQDFEIRLFDNHNLLLIGSFDFSYYHEVEILFYNTSFVFCHTNIITKLIRLANEEEIKYFSKNVYLSENNHLIALDDKFQRGSNYIVAQSMDYKFDLVKYFDVNGKLVNRNMISEWAKYGIYKDVDY